ncbi:hypothetical protein SAMN04488057_11121 [Cyclobacterium lianum]|uniref:Uncharacterized protein n=1 Tax=Cyclobacterium lianum TaxID=388280 RepID=A0A1M7PVI1_9BACT|nr:hypothetical protein [Cyclobacterium lianum]SHN21591.1 hypothetical protein SAMN04488057_11121 [Cyclobacterium lianum]
MQKNLYLVCPANHLEAFLQQKFGTDHFFLTALGSVFRFDEVRFVEQVADFLMQGRIDQILMVQDLNCPFKNRIINHEKGLSCYAEEYLFDLYIDHYYQINQCASRREKARKLALVHSRNLAQTIYQHPLLEGPVKQQGIKIVSLLIDWKSNLIEKVAHATQLENVVVH